MQILRIPLKCWTVWSNITFAFMVDIFLKLCISIAYSGALSWAIFTISHSWLDWNYHGGFALSFSFLCGDPETKQTQDALTILRRKLMFDRHAWASFPGSSIFCLIWSSVTKHYPLNIIRQWLIVHKLPCKVSTLSRAVVNNHLINQSTEIYLLDFWLFVYTTA